ncbi:MAG TPA: cell wall-binding repeat-containing protein, partial [Euzebya sp.]|nr:cell wall-binding repeat-containing protein [Euzebya sp.]
RGRACPEVIALAGRIPLVGLVAACLAVAVVAAATPVGSQQPRGAQDWRRIGDSADPVVASVLIAQNAFPDTGDADGVVLAREDVFADALAGAALAGTTRPILYTTGGPDAELRPEVAAEIGRLLGEPRGCGEAPEGEVLVLGGEQAVSAAASAPIEGQGYCVRRFAGASRVETSVQIAEEVIDRSGGAARPLLVSRDDTFADAATGGALAAYQGSPLVVTPTGSLHPAVGAFLDGQEIAAAVLLGGEAALSAAVEDALANAVEFVGRLAGPSREATAAEIAAGPWRHTPVAGVTLVNGFAADGYTYAIASAVTAARGVAPQLYVQPDGVPAATADVIAGYAQRTTLDVVVVGPGEAVADATAAQAQALADDPPTPPEPVVAFAVDAHDAAERGVWLVDGADGSGLRRLVDGSVGVPSWTDDGQAMVVPIFDSTMGANGVVEVGLDGTVTQLVEYFDSGAAFAQTSAAPIRIPDANAFRSHSSRPGALPAGRFLAVDQLRQVDVGQQVREIVVYDMDRPACTGEGCARLFILPSPQWRFAGSNPWLSDHELLVIENGMLVVLDVFGRQVIRTDIPATSVAVIPGAVAVSHEGGTRIVRWHLTGEFEDIRPPLDVGGGEVAWVYSESQVMGHLLLLVEDENGDVYVRGDSSTPVRIIPGGTREAIGLDAGPLGEEIVITGFTAAGPQGQIIRPPVDGGEATTVATWEVTAQNGPDGRTFAVQVQPVGGP